MLVASPLSSLAGPSSLGMLAAPMRPMARPVPPMVACPMRPRFFTQRIHSNSRTSVNFPKIDTAHFILAFNLLARNNYVLIAHVQDAVHVRDVFYRMGFNDREIVALIGAHTLGFCHTDRSGYLGPWTT